MRLQEWIHQLEVGAGVRYVRLAAVLFGFLALALVYDLFEYQNFSNPESMDAAQVARNLSRGEGFTTQCVRPLSIYLVEQHQQSLGVRTNDFGMLDKRHPDLANPPLYPLLLAGTMRLLPFAYEIPRGRQYRQYQPDLLIALVNQALFLLLACLTFRLALGLFDATIAWGSVVALAGSELLWRFSVSGLSTMLLLNLFVLLVMCLVSLERRARENAEERRSLILLGIAAGLLVGLGTLTRYSFGWLILPVGVYLAVFIPRGRVVVPLAAVLAFIIALSPWLARNHRVSGTWFGTAGYACLEGIYPTKPEEIERSLHVPSSELSLADGAMRKLLVNLPSLVQDQVITLGGSWLTSFFLVGLLVPFMDAGRNRLRWFVVGSMGLWILVEALGKTYLSSESRVNNENLLIVLAPVVFIFGMAWFSTLLDQVSFPFFRAREAVTAAFLLLLCAPLILALLPPRRNVHAFPPYHPFYIQTLCDWMGKDEMMMGDLPWANAWYGDRQCVWLPLRFSDARHEEDFYAINDSRKPVRALHLSHPTLDQSILTSINDEQERGAWGQFGLRVIQAYWEIQRALPSNTNAGAIPEPVQRELLAIWSRTFRELAPGGFPLLRSPLSYVKGGQLFLTDRERWVSPTP